MRSKQILLLVVFFLISAKSISQNTINKTFNVTYNTGLELLDKKKYAAAREFFERFLLENRGDNKSIEAEYFIAFSALNLFNPDAESLFEEFIRKYPYHSKSTSAYYDLGSFYYNNKKYDKTILYLEQVNFMQLSESQRIESKFRLAYSYFSQKDFEKAGPLFNQIKSYNHKYTYASSYYAAYLEYRNDEFEASLKDLKKAEESDAYKNLVPLMIVNIYYKVADYDNMLSYAEGVLSRTDKPQGMDEILLLSGEAAYKKKDYKKASEFFKKYFNDYKNKSTSDIQYRYAYSLFNTGQYAEAAITFKNIAGPKDSIGQASSYYLGLSYLKLDNKLYAYAAFDQARKATTYPTIKEESLYNFAKVSFSLEKYGEAVQALKEFTKLFPKSDHIEDVQDLFSDALLRTNNYSEGLIYIEGLKSRSLKVNTAYQKIAFYRASELFNTEKYEEAIQLFDKSIQFSFDKDTYLAAHFWKAECYSILRDYPNAINTYAVVFQKSLPNDSEFYLKTRYGIGYAYYNSQQYEKALPHFREYTNKLKDEQQKLNYYDALLRLADLYYVTKQYQEAIKYYDVAIAESPVDKDYAFFQKGIVLGLTSNLKEAIKNFDIVISNYKKSLYYDDAVFQKSELELESSNYNSAIQGFSTIIQSWPSSGFVPYAYLKRAVSYSNIEKYNDAVNDYKIILDKYPDHSVANNALLGLQNAVALSGSAQDLTSIIAKYKELNPTSDALINVEFENAKSMYNSQNYNKAIDAFKNYISVYPGSPNNSEGTFYIGESYFRLNNFAEALNAYKVIAKDKTSPYYNRAIQRLAEIAYSNGAYEDAKVNYHELLTIAKNKKERFNAWMGLMETYYQLNNYDSSFAYTKQILEHGNAAIDAENKAYLYQGKIAYKQGKLEDATDYFLNTVNNAKDENAVEAQYTLAEIQAKEQKFKQSNESLFELNNNFPNYPIWLGRSFLLIAENYVAQNEIFQAKATLHSIIEKSPDQESKERAKQRLEELEKMEKPENSETGDQEITE